MSPRAMLFLGAGQPLRAVPQSTAAPRGGEILVRILSCTLCRSDLATYSGRRNEPTPIVLGHEAVGTIAAFGPVADRREAAIGDRITWAIVASCGECFFCRNGLQQKCERGVKYGHHATNPDSPNGGGLAETIALAPGTAWFPVPAHLTSPVASLANCAGATVAAILEAAGAIEERSILIFGAGLLGVFASAMARSRGARCVIAIDPDRGCRERALAFGATHALDPRWADFAEELRILTCGRGADLALELAGRAETVEQCLAHVRIGGTVILAGTVSPTPAVLLDPQQFVRRLLTLRGVHNYQPRHLQAALEFLADSRYPWESLIAATFPLDRAEAAFAAALIHPGRRVAVIPSERSS